MISPRVFGFGVVLFFVMIALAVVYTIFTRNGSGTVDQMANVPKTVVPTPSTSGTTNPPLQTQPLPANVTPDTATDELIDEASKDDSNDLSQYTDDEMADIKDGSK